MTSTERERSGPLAGVRVVDFTANMSGPFATMILGDQGADVIKVEPPEGDVIRAVGTGVAGMSAYFANLNRSKRSLAVDLNRAEAEPVMRALLDSADVVIHNLRSAAAVRLGLDAGTARRGRPSLVHATIDGFGREGPYGGRPAYDHVIQALSGFAARQIDPKRGEPSLIRQGIVDKLTGQAAAQAVTAALFERASTGNGQTVEVCMLDVAVSVLWPDGMMNHTMIEPDTVLPSVSHSFRLTPTSDGHIAFALLTTRQFAMLRDAVGLPGGEPLDTAEARMRQGGAVLRDAARTLAGHTTAEAVEMLAAHDIPVAPVVSLEALHDDPQIRANAILREFDHPVLGAVRQADPAVRFNGARPEDLTPAPQLGQHDREAVSYTHLTLPTICSV